MLSSVAPGPRGHPLLGSLPDVRRDPIRLFVDSFRRYGDVVRFRFGPMVAHLISAPAGVNHVLAENHRNYGKQTRGYRNLRYVLGNGLLTSEGDLWKRQRRIAQPAFHRQRIAGFGATMARTAREAAQSLSAAPIQPTRPTRWAPRSPSCSRSPTRAAPASSICRR